MRIRALILCFDSLFGISAEGSEMERHVSLTYTSYCCRQIPTRSTSCSWSGSIATRSRSTSRSWSSLASSLSTRVSWSAPRLTRRVSGDVIGSTAWRTRRVSGDVIGADGVTYTTGEWWRHLGRLRDVHDEWVVTSSRRLRDVWRLDWAPEWRHLQYSPAALFNHVQIIIIVKVRLVNSRDNNLSRSVLTRRSKAVFVVASVYGNCDGTAIYGAIRWLEKEGNNPFTPSDATCSVPEIKGSGKV